MVGRSGKSFYNAYFNKYKEDTNVFINRCIAHFEEKYDLPPKVVTVSAETWHYLEKNGKLIDLGIEVIVGKNLVKGHININDEISEVNQMLG